MRFLAAKVSAPEQAQYLELLREALAQLEGAAEPLVAPAGRAARATSLSQARRALLFGFLGIYLIRVSGEGELLMFSIILLGCRNVGVVRGWWHSEEYQLSSNLVGTSSVMMNNLVDEFFNKKLELYWKTVEMVAAAEAGRGGAHGRSARSAAAARRGGGRRRLPGAAADRLLQPRMHGGLLNLFP